MKTKQRVVIVGASDRPERYSYLAMALLRQHGHEVVPIHPKLKEIEGVPVLADLSDVKGPVDTVTMYVGHAISDGMKETLAEMQPKRVIFNPGAENGSLSAYLTECGILCEEACTLVLLNTGRF